MEQARVTIFKFCILILFRLHTFDRTKIWRKLHYIHYRFIQYWKIISICNQIMLRTEKIRLKSFVIADCAGAAVIQIFIFGSLREVLWPCMLCLSQVTFWCDQTGRGSTMWMCPGYIVSLGVMEQQSTFDWNSLNGNP